MRRQYILAMLVLVALLAAAPSWNDTTCDASTPLPAALEQGPGFLQSPLALDVVP